MNYQSESEVQRMKELMGYGINEQTVNTGGSKPIVEYKMKAADGKTYGIIHECNKFYIKVAPKKDTEVLAEDFDYIGGWNNRKENEYKTYAMASKQFDLKMMSINEANTHKVEIQQFKPVESSEWQINETKEMRSELERFRQITNNVAVILKEDKNVLPAEHTLPEAPASNPSKDKVNSPFTDTAVANGDKDTKQSSTDPKKEGQPYDNETKVTDNDMQSDKKPNGDGKDDTYSEKAKYVPDNSVADKRPSGGKVAKVDESQRRTFKLTEEQVLAWSKSKDYLDTSKGTEIGDKSPYTETPSDVNEENAVHNTDNQNVPTPGNGEIGDDSPFTEKVNEDSANVDDVAGMPSNDDDDDTDDVPFPEVEDGGAYLDFEKDYNDWEDNGGENQYDVDLDSFDLSDDDDFEGVKDDVLANDTANYGDDDDFYEGKQRKGRNAIRESELNVFGKHPAYRKAPMTTPPNTEVAKNGAKDWNDESAKGEKPFGEKIGSSAPFDKVIDTLTNAIMKKLNF